MFLASTSSTSSLSSDEKAVTLHYSQDRPYSLSDGESSHSSSRKVRNEYNHCSSEVRVVRTPASGAVDSGLIPSRVKPMILKLVLRPPCLTLSIKGAVWQTSRQVYLLCRWENRLAKSSILQW